MNKTNATSVTIEDEADVVADVEAIHERLGILPVQHDINSVIKNYAGMVGEKKAARLFSAVKSGNPLRFYPEMNASLAAVRASAAIFPAPRYWTAELIERNVTCGTAVDIGCGNGLGTCTLAALAPDLEIHGVDPEKFGIDRACEIAELLELDNVHFYTDIEDVPQVDTVLSSMTVHEIVGLEKMYNTYCYDTPGLIAAAAEKMVSVADIYASHVRPGGRLYSIERFPSLQLWTAWVGALQGVGFEISIDECSYPTWQTMHGDESFPVTVATMTGESQPAVSAELHHIWFTESCDFDAHWNPRVVQIDQAE
jgi:hypothetical protein